MGKRPHTHRLKDCEKEHSHTAQAAHKQRAERAWGRWLGESLENYLERELLTTRRLNERNQFALGMARGALVDVPFPLQ